MPDQISAFSEGSSETDVSEFCFLENIIKAALFTHSIESLTAAQLHLCISSCLRLC